MFGQRFKLFNLFGFEVHIDSSWLFLAILVIWSLAMGFFPMHIPGLTSGSYLIMGIFGAAGLFASIVLHEMCHSLVARKYGLPMKGITLFIFGGVAEMGDEPSNAKTEFLMAAAGPAFTILLALFFFGMLSLGMSLQWTGPVLGLVYYLGFINIVLAIFNLLPAFPLDGGRMLRAALWGKTKNLKKSTRIASLIGKGFGLVLIALGIFSLLTGNFIGAIWWVLIGMFLRGAAGASYQQVVTREALQGEPVSRFMNIHPDTVPATIPLDRFVQDYVYRFHHKMFPVVENGELVGCISTQQIHNVPRDQWSSKTVGEVARECSTENTISAQTDAVHALARMSQTGNTRLLVTDHQKLIGLITLKDIMKFFVIEARSGRVSGGEVAGSLKTGFYRM